MYHKNCGTTFQKKNNTRTSSINWLIAAEPKKQSVFMRYMYY